MTRFPAVDRSGIPLVDLARIGLILGMISAVWAETDLYRYCALGLALPAAFAYFTRLPRPPMGWVATLCFAWAAYVTLRYGFTHIRHPDTEGGSAEGIYLFPFLYPATGFALYKARHLVMPVAWCFMALSLVLLLASVDIGDILSGERTSFLYHQNTIHASVGGGFIVLAAICFGLHLLTSEQRGRWRLAGVAVAAAVITLGLLGILGAQSKGVWIAVAGAMPVLALMILINERRNMARGAAAAVIGFGVVLAIGFDDRIGAALGPSVSGATNMAAAIADAGADVDALDSALDAVIATEALPSNFNERLMLWVNAAELWSVDPILGVGVYWEDLWPKTSYAEVPYQLIHNGYLEIGMRYGLVGLVFYALLAGWVVQQSHDAHRRGDIGTYLYVLHLVALVYFLLTILTNSNNRLAPGESFMWLAAAFGFCCYYMKFEGEAEDPALAATPAAAGTSER